jgi:hypothetical protein
MLWGSYFGGSGSSGDGWTPSVRVDGAGNLFFLTFTQDNDVPITQGVYQTSRRGGWDMVLAKISPTGQLLASTFFGGTLNEYTETHGLALQSSRLLHLRPTCRRPLAHMIERTLALAEPALEPVLTIMAIAL